MNDHFERLRLASEQICRMSLLPDCIEERGGDGILCQASIYYTVKEECGIFLGTNVYNVYSSSADVHALPSVPDV